MEKSHAALGEFIRGNAELANEMWSQAEDVTLGNPFGPFTRGWQAVTEAAADAAARFRDGQVVGFEPIGRYLTDDLACVVEVERFRAKIGASSELTETALRVTTVFRREATGWKLVHRHADPIPGSQT